MKYRLGNECEEYAELQLDDSVRQFGDGSSLGYFVSAQLYNEYGHSLKFGDDHGFSWLNQGYLEWKDMPLLNGGHFWAGRRWYNRNDIHISDFFYWNQSATGFGVDQVQLGDYYFSYVFSRKDNQAQKDYASKHDLTLEGFKPNLGGGIRLGLSMIQSPSGDDKHGGWAAIVEHTQDNFMGWGGKNKLAIQYGEGAGTGLSYTGDLSLDNKNKSWRLVEFFDWQQGRWGGQAQFVYQKDVRDAGDSQRWVSVGARPYYALSEDFKFIVEIGRDQIAASEGTRKLTKITLAPTWAPQGTGFWDRPELRFYYTYATWNRAAQRAANSISPGSALSDSGAFGSDRNGANYGFQMEYWWK